MRRASVSIGAESRIASTTTEALQASAGLIQDIDISTTSKISFRAYNIAEEELRGSNGQNTRSCPLTETPV